MRASISLFLFATHLALSSPFSAQDLASATKTLTVDDALALAEKQSPLLKASEAEIEAARAGTMTARTYQNPEFNALLGNQYIRLPTSVPGLLQHYGYSQGIELPSVRRTRIEVGRRGEESSRFALANTENLVRFAVRQAFSQVLRRKSELSLAQEDLGIAQDLRRRIGVQVQTGEAARLELSRAESEITSVRALVKTAELNLAGAKFELRAVVGGLDSVEFDVTGSPGPGVPLPSVEELRKQVVSNHPSIALANSEIRRAEALLASERALRVPQPSIVTEYEQQPDLRFFRTGLAVPLPIFDRRRGQIAEASARLTQTRAVARQRTLEITAALEKAYSQYQIADQQIASYESGSLRQARVALDAAQVAYKFGERSILEVLDAQRVLHSVNSDYLNSQFDRDAALIELQRLRAIDYPRTNP